MAWHLKVGKTFLSSKMTDFCNTTRPYLGHNELTHWPLGARWHYNLKHEIFNCPKNKTFLVFIKCFTACFFFFFFVRDLFYKITCEYIRETLLKEEAHGLPGLYRIACIEGHHKQLLETLDQGEFHYTDVIMGAIASQITSLTIVYSTVYTDEDQRRHQSSASLAFVRGIHRGPVNPPHKWPVTRKMSPFDDVIMHLDVGSTMWPQQPMTTHIDGLVQDCSISIANTLEILQSCI